MTRLGAFAAVVGLCAVCLASGFLGAYLYVSRSERADVRPRVEGPRAVRPLDHYARRLDLDEAQVREIHAILEDSRRRGDALRDSLRPQVEALMDETRERIRGVLDDDQRARLESMRQRDRERFERLLFERPQRDGRRRRMPR